MKRALALSCIAGLLLGSAVGAFMMYAAWQHNPQGSIHDEGGVDWGYWLLIGASWLAAAGGPATATLSVLSCGGVAIRRWVQRRRRASSFS